jgi:hypothetical protein
MGPIRDKVVSIFNDQLAALREFTKQSEQAIFVSLYTFESAVDEARVFAAPASTARRLRVWPCRGMTALFDATGLALRDLRTVPAAGSKDTAFLVVVLTDGHENASKLYKTKLPGMLATAQNTQRFTFAFLVPQGGVAACQRLGIPDGNIQTWTPTTKGTEVMGRALGAAVKRFVRAREKGATSSTQVFRRPPAQRPAPP